MNERTWQVSPPIINLRINREIKLCFNTLIYLCFTEEKSSLLVIVIDTNPVWWGQRHMKQDEHVSQSRIIAQAIW